MRHSAPLRPKPIAVRLGGVLDDQHPAKGHACRAEIAKRAVKLRLVGVEVGSGLGMVILGAEEHREFLGPRLGIGSMDAERIDPCRVERREKLEARHRSRRIVQATQSGRQHRSIEIGGDAQSQVVNRSRSPKM